MRSTYYDVSADGPIVGGIASERRWTPGRHLDRKLLIAFLLVVSGCASPDQRPATDASPQTDSTSQAETSQMYNDLRGMVLSGRVPDADGPSAALMEVGLEGGTATLVAIADGSTSLYLSNGGGVIGAGEHASVREAASAFLRSASDHIDKLEATTDQPLPAEGSVRFYVNNGGSLRTAEVEEQELTKGVHALSALYAAGQKVLTAVRETSNNQQ